MTTAAKEHESLLVSLSLICAYIGVTARSRAAKISSAAEHSKHLGTLADFRSLGVTLPGHLPPENFPPPEKFAIHTGAKILNLSKN